MLKGLTKVREFDGVLNEENWDVVAHNVPIAFFCIELDGKATDVSYGIGTATAALNGREAHENGGLPRSVGQHGRIRDILCTFEEGEFAKGASSTSMNNTLGNTLMIETMDLGPRLFVDDFCKSQITYFLPALLVL